MDLNEIKIIKKDGTFQDFKPEKIVIAIHKSAGRVMVNLTEDDDKLVVDSVIYGIKKAGLKQVPIKTMHALVENALDKNFPDVAKSYRDYRNYKHDFVDMLDDVYKKSQSIMYIGDKENSNADSALVSTKRSLIYSELNKSLYKKFFLNKEELEAFNDGYIYIHDMNARRDCINCCLFDMASVLKGGFEMGNLWYNEPKTLDVAFDVIGDVTLSAAAQQYGGFSIVEIDKILAPYAEKSYKIYLNKYLDLGIPEEKAKEIAMKDVEKDYKQGFQGFEYKFNTVGSSRGDYPKQNWGFI